MGNEQETINKEEAAATLRSVESTKRDAQGLYRQPLLLIIFSGLSYALFVFSWGMTEHENLWALGMYIGGGGFLLSLALSVYTSRVLGIKLRHLPKTKDGIIFFLVQMGIFALLVSGGRLVRFAGFEFGPHIAALISGILVGYLLYEHPSVEYVAKEESHG